MFSILLTGTLVAQEVLRGFLCAFTWFVHSGEDGL
jgi:hypothetical protein